MKNMKKSDLKTSMVVETRDGNRYMVLRGDIPDAQDGAGIIANHKGYISIARYNDGMNLDASSSGDIMKVYRPTAFGLDAMLSVNDNLIWERKELDWGLVEEDTKVLVSDSFGVWHPYYFSYTDSEGIHIFSGGRDSFTAKDIFTINPNRIVLYEGNEHLLK